MSQFLLENDFISAILAFGLVLIPAIIIHEFGHFVAAKGIGVSVLEFGVGFPPRLARLFTWQGTEFTLNWLPIGGFVRPLGEDFIGPVDEGRDLSDEEKAKNDSPFIGERDELRARGVPEAKIKSLNEAKPIPRIIFMVMGALFNFASAIIAFALVGLIGLPQVVGARAQIVDLGDSSVFAGTPVQVGDAVERLNGELFATTSDFLQQWMALEGETVRLSLRTPSTNASYEIEVVAQGQVTAYVLVTGVAQGSPASEAGLQAGDLIWGVNGEPLPFDMPVDYLIALATEQAGQEVFLLVERAGERLEIPLVPRQNPPANQGRIGISIASQYGSSDGLSWGMAQNQEELVPLDLFSAISYGFNRTGEVLATIVSIPSQLVAGTISPEEARPVSIVGISQVGGQFLQQSINEGTPVLMLNFFALVSIFLGFTNLLPLPPLDGGRVLFVLIEMLRGKPVPFHIENLVYRVGITFLLGLGVLVIFYDLINPLSLPQ